MIPVAILLVVIPLVAFAAMLIIRAGAAQRPVVEPEAESTLPSIPIPYTLRPPPPSVCGQRQAAWMALTRDERVRRISRYLDDCPAPVCLLAWCPACGSAPCEPCDDTDEVTESYRRVGGAIRVEVRHG